MLGLPECVYSHRLQGLAELAPPASRLKVVSPANSTERRFAVWIGALQHSLALARWSVALAAHRLHDDAAQTCKSDMHHLQLLPVPVSPTEQERLNVLQAVQS